MKRRKKLLMYWGILFAFSIAVGFIFQQMFIVPTTVKGESMLPTFKDNSKILVIRNTHVGRFDIVVFKSPVSNEYHIKRVIGLGGDTVEMRNDQLYINGVYYPEPYIDKLKRDLKPDQKLTEDFRIQIPDNYLFVMGDNRMRSRDSRSYGYISEDAVSGEAKLQLAPFYDLGLIK